MTRWWVVAFLGVLGCSEESAAPPEEQPPGEGGAGGGVGGCPPGEEALEDGSCLPAGIPDGACGDGFESDGTGSCRVVLPGAPCRPGELAVPGDARCRPVAPCGDGTWGAIPVDDTTQFVDAGYTGTDSDGSQARPWTTIQAGIDAALEGAIVAVAEGTYLEDPQIVGTAVRLWGRCPGLVEVSGTALATLLVAQGADGAEVRDIAITGEGAGVAVSGAEGVLFDRVWVHDTGGRGMAVQDQFGPTSVTVRGSLVEAAHRYGVQLDASTLTLEESVVRGTLTDTEPFGLGISVFSTAELTLRKSIVEQSVAIGVFVEDGTLTVESSLVRDTKVDPTGSLGRGVEVHSRRAIGERLPFIWKDSLVERSEGAGIVLAGADATFEGLVIRESIDVGSQGRGLGIEIHDLEEAPSRATVHRSVLEANHLGLNAIASEVTLTGSLVRGQTPNADGATGAGIVMQGLESGAVRGLLTVKDSALENNHEVGILVVGSDAIVEHSLVRATRANMEAVESGFGLAVYRHDLNGQRSTALVRDSLLERNTSAGLLSAASDLTIERCVVRDTQGAANGRKGRGVHAEQDYELDVEPSLLIIRQTTIEQSQEFGVMINASHAILEDVIVRGVSPNGLGRYGDGIAVVGIVEMPDTGTLELYRSRIEGAARAGMAVFGGSAFVQDTTFECNAIDLDGEEFFGRQYAVQDQGGNACGCQDDTETCTVRTSMLEAPEPL